MVATLVIADGPGRNQGFTVLELVVVIVIAGIIAAVATARFVGTGGFESRGFHDQAITLVRFAQKTAIGQRRTVFVVATADRIAACYDGACASRVLTPFEFPRTPAMAAGLSKCAGDATWLCAGAPDGVGVGAANFSFSSLGRPSASANISVSGDIGRQIVVEAETGYVHP